MPQNPFFIKQLLILLLSFNSYILNCQSAIDTTSKTWISSGYTLFLSSSDGGFGLHLSLDNYKNKNLWKIHLTKSLEISRFFSAGISYGRATISKYIRLSISGGLGVIHAIKIMENQLTPSGPHGPTPHPDQESFTVPSFPLEAQFSILPSKYFGIGLSGFAILNFKSTFYGFRLSLELGKLK